MSAETSAGVFSGILICFFLVLTICLGGGRLLFAYRAPPPPVLNRLGLQHESKSLAQGAR